MTLYSIQDTTLTGIADGLRKWYGETKTVTVSGMRPVPLKVVSKTPNATGFDTRSGGYGNGTNLYDVVTIPGASIIKVKIAYQTENTVYDYVQVAAGNLTTMPSDATKYGYVLLTTTELTFKGTDTITFYFHSDSSNDAYLGYYAECYGLDENGNFVLSDEEEMQTWEEEIPNTFKPEEMGAAIDNYQYFSDEELTFSGDCPYLFAYGNWKNVVEQEKNRIQVGNVTNANSMFINSPYEDLSWLTISSNNSTWTNTSNLFKDSTNLKKLPTVKDFVFYTNQSSAIFQNCYELTDVDGIINFFKNNKFCSSTPQSSYWFGHCYSLRNIDAVMPYIKTAWETENAKNYMNYNNMFANCYSLDELNNVYVNPNSSAVTSNRLSDIVRICARLKNFTFETNEDSSPIVVSWKSQTLDLSYSVGCYSIADKGWQNIYSYSSGITADKQVQDAATYAALKDDPDWFTLKEEYSRYNHDSAVNTINSLPDTSAYLASAGGTNTIKFKGASGSATDGGAINTLTEEEIAVATAKGWTVTLT
jgi:hypothetical protein